MIAIAIDGPSGAGKSTFAKALARDFGYVYLDTGAIYRTVALYMQRNKVNCKDEKAVTACFPDIHIDISHGETGTQDMILNGETVTGLIRTPEVSIGASDVSALPAVRAFLMDLQRSFAKKYNVIMDGRDIGTVVLPDAQVKIFLTASAEVRAERRYKELIEKGQQVDYESVLEDMKYRDAQDSSRAAAPLKAADDAIIVDTGSLNLEESHDLLKRVIEKRLSESV